MKKRHLSLLLAMTLVVALFAQSGAALEPSAVVRPVFTGATMPIERGHTIEDIVAMAEAHPHTGFSRYITTRYATTPSFTVPYAAGSLNTDDLDDAKNAIIMCRYLAGVPYDNVTLPSELNDIAQHGAVLLAASNQFAHEPTKPADMPEAFFDKGFIGCSNANINAGRTNISNVVIGLMADAGANNIERAGHRRWVLKPYSQAFGLGFAQNTSGSILYQGARTNMHVFDNSSAMYTTQADTYIAWPSAGAFPIQYFAFEHGMTSAPAYPWSINLGAAYSAPDKALMTLTLTRARDGKVWTFDKNTPSLAGVDSAPGMHFASDDGGYGIRKAITFRPDLASLGALEDGDTFTVNITGIKTAAGADTTLTYTINFFDLEAAMTPIVPVTFTISGTSKTYNGAAQGVTVTADPAGAEYRVLYNGSTTLPKNAGSYDVTVEATGEGFTGSQTATLTIAKKSLSVSGLTVKNRGYSAGDVSAEVDASAYTLTGKVAGDDVALNTALLSAVFSTDQPGASVPAVISGLALTGSDRNNYTLASTTVNTTAAIYASVVPVTFTVSGTSKTYNGATQGVSVSTSPAGAVYSVRYNGSTTLPKNAGSYAVVVEATGEGFTGSQTATLTIAKKTLTVSGLTVKNRVYSAGDVSAEVDASAYTLTGKVSGDNVALNTALLSAVFSTDQPGANVPAVISGLALTGSASANYTLASTTVNTTAAIYASVVPVTFTISGTSKTYNGATQGVTVTSSPTGAAYTVRYNGSTTLPKNAGSYAVVVEATGAGFTGSQTATLTIAKKSLSVSGLKVKSRNYKAGSVAAEVDASAYSLVGKVSGDNVALNTALLTAKFSTDQPGTSVPAVISGLALTGSASANYTLASTTVNTTAAITMPAWINPYTDVAKSDWFYSAVAYVSQRGLMSGMAGGTTFAPMAPLSRAMVATVLYRMSGSPSETYSAIFTDVPNGQWYSKPITWAYRNNIVGGKGNGLFGTNENISREQLAAMIYRYAQFRKIDTSATVSLTGYTDAKAISSYAVTPMRWAVAVGIISGKTKTTLNPSGFANRAECATILMRFDILLNS